MSDVAWFYFDIVMLALLTLSGVGFAASYEDPVAQERSFGPLFFFTALFFTLLLVMIPRVVYLLFVWIV